MMSMRWLVNPNIIILNRLGHVIGPLLKEVIILCGFLSQNGNIWLFWSTNPSKSRWQEQSQEKSTCFRIGASGDIEQIIVKKFI